LGGGGAPPQIWGVVHMSLLNIHIADIKTRKSGCYSTVPIIF
jgi:hypothetical protein